MRIDSPSCFAAILVVVFLPMGAIQGQPPDQPIAPAPQKESYYGRSDPPLVPPLVLPHDGQVWSVAFTPDGRYITSATISGVVRLWDAREGKLLWQKRLGGNSPIEAMALSPDGKLL